MEDGDRRWAFAGAVEIDADGRLLGGASPRRRRPRTWWPASPAQPHACRILERDGPRETFSKIEVLDEALRHLADWDLWLRLGEVGIPACASEPLVAYRIHRSQAPLDTTGMIEELACSRLGTRRTQ